MSVQPIGNPGPDDLYCDPIDVASYFDKYDVFDTDTNPSEQEVRRRIAGESNWVDTHTGHAWRERTVQEEYHDLSGLYRWQSGTPISLGMRDIRTPLDSAKDDKLEVWDGSNWIDYVSNTDYKEGRNEDFWIEDSIGMLYLYRRYVFSDRHREIRLTYRYGKQNVPQDIRDAVAKRVAATFLESQQYRVTTPENDDGPNAEKVAETWREQTEKDVDKYTEIKSTGL